MENKKFIGENITIQKAANILSCYKEGDELLKAYNDSIVKAEGARGGTVIGHTKSGKPIYETKKIGTDSYHKINHKISGDKWISDSHEMDEEQHRQKASFHSEQAHRNQDQPDRLEYHDEQNEDHIKHKRNLEKLNKEKNNSQSQFEEKNKPADKTGALHKEGDEVEYEGKKYKAGKYDPSTKLRYLHDKETGKHAEDSKEDKLQVHESRLKKSEDEEIFDERTLALENGLILLKSFDHSHLVQKKVQVKGKDGSIHYAIRYVDPNTDKSPSHPHASGNYSHIVDSDVAKIEAIISGGGTGIQKARDLADMGIYDKKVLLVLSGAHPPQISSVLKDMDVASVQSNPSSKPVPTEHTGENMPVSDGNGFPPPNLGDLSKNQLKRVLESQRSKLRSDAGLTYKDFWGSYERTLKGVIMDGYPKSLIAYGTGGLGKTYTLDKVMEANQVRVYDQEINPSSDQYDAVVIKGGTGIRDMWTIICKNRDKLIVFDDCDSMWDPSQESAQNILKGMLDTTGDGSVRYGQAGKDEDGIQLPKQIKFTGQVIFVSNLKREAFPQPLISSRCGAIDLTMSKDETLDKLLEIKDHVKLRGKGGAELEIPTASRDAAYDFFQRHKNQLDIGQVNARLFAQVAQVHKMMSADNDLASFEKEAMIRTNLV